MILYTEEVLEDCYKIYRLHQMRKAVPFIMKEDFRALFEEMMDRIYIDEEG